MAGACLECGMQDAANLRSPVERSAIPIPAPLESRFEQYELNLEIAPPLIARKHRYRLKERIAGDGSVLLALDDDEVTRLADRIAGAK